MKRIWLYLLLFPLQLSVKAQSMTAEDYYVHAFNEMSDMLAGRDTLSIKRAVYLAEWAFYEGILDYKTDFCNEIDRITTFIQSLPIQIENLILRNMGIKTLRDGTDHAPLNILITNYMSLLSFR